MPPQDGLGLHDQKRMAPISEPSTGANPELPVRIAQAQVLGNRQRRRPESRQNGSDEKVKHPIPPPNPAVAEGEGSRLSTTKPADGNLAPYRPPSQGRKTFLRNHADNGRFSPSVMNSLASISVVLWPPTGFADGGGNARTILRALDQLASSRPFGPKSRIKSGHGRPLSPINCSDMVSISNCPRQVNSSPSNWKDSSILPSQKCSTR
jgi:hypothetical protein